MINKHSLALQRCALIIQHAQNLTGDNATAISSLIGALIELSQQSSDQAEVLQVAIDALTRAKGMVERRAEGRVRA